VVQVHPSPPKTSAGSTSYVDSAFSFVISTACTLLAHFAKSVMKQVVTTSEIRYLLPTMDIVKSPSRFAAIIGKYVIWQWVAIDKIRNMLAIQT
jgi:hypothetical protein